MTRANGNVRKFKCAACGSVFELSGREKDMKCPACKSKILILLEGPSLSKSGCLEK